MSYSSAFAAEVIEQHRHVDGACLPILHALQEKFGFVPSEAVAQIAEALNLSRADVHGVLTFYKDFRTTAGGSHVVRVCAAESCQAVGGAEVMKGIERHLGIAHGETTADGAVTLERVFCLGNCALSPAIVIDDKIHGRVEAEQACGLIDRACGKALS